MFEDMSHPYRDTARAVPLVVIWTIVAVGLAVLASALWLGYARIYRNQETAVIRQTNQYQTSTQQHLVVLMGAYADLDAKATQHQDNPQAVRGFRDQQHAILLEMRQQTATLQPDQVPPDVRAFLRQHPY